MRILTAIVLALFLSGCAVASRNASVSPDSIASISTVDPIVACQIPAGAKPGEFPCAVDSIELISKPRAFCGTRIVTFGYIANTWGQLALYPDEARANAQFIHSAVSLGSRLGRNKLNLLVGRGSGFYAEILGQFECNDTKEFGLGAIELERVTVFDATQGDDARERIVFSAPAAVKDQ